MKSLQTVLTEKMSAAFAAAGYDASYGLVRLSDRPDLCEFQCNGAMAGAKKYRKAPFVIAEETAKKAEELFHGDAMEISVVRPGFININVVPSFLSPMIEAIGADEHLSIPQTAAPKKILIDYGGPNVAKPLHVGHLRSAVIGESIKRILRASGHEVLGDVHLGDWGLQMGLIIYEMSQRKPDLPYFAENVPEDAYPEAAPFTLSELEEIYPFASGKSKTDEEYKAKAMEATHELQMGRPGYRALWKKIMELSIADLKKNYEELKSQLLGLYGAFSETLNADKTAAGQKALEARYTLHISGKDLDFVQYFFY